MTRQLVAGYSVDGVLANQMLSATGAANPSETYKNKLLTVGIGANSPYALTSLPAANAWGVVAVDFNNDTGLVSISRDGVAWSVTQREKKGNTIGDTGYVTIGLPSASTGLTDNLIGDFFLFGDSLRSEASDDMIAALIKALKADYGITA